MSDTPDDATRPIAGSRPAIAIVCNSHTPYRTHLHLRVARELSEVRLFTLYTHETSNSNWGLAAPAEIGPVLFGKGEAIANQDRLTRQWREWRRGGRMIDWLTEHEIRFVLMMGYNDAGRLRIMRWCHRTGTPCYLFGDSNVHGDTAKGAKAMVKRWLLHRVLSWCEGVFACGTLGQQYFARYGATADQTFLFPYEPDYELIRRVSPDAAAGIAGRFGLKVGHRRILFSGRLVPEKRVDLLVDAFSAIADERPLWDLLLVGDGPLRATLQARIPKQLKGRVFWTGFLDDQETVSGLYASSDVLVLPSDYEPWALVINEAAAAGLAIVSTDVVGAAAELVQDGVNGRLFQPGNLGQLVECLREVTTPERCDQMRAAAPAVLAAWRDRGDPVAGLRSALVAAKVI